ncbi:MAG: hypothetical protein L6R39_004659 [Caloplaca ligustica]|nr:MAG: hypothetical protein L6R39_004659 [Caloplaca ligustica]
MSGGPSIIRRPVFEKSNVELVSALRANFVASREASMPVDNNNGVRMVDGESSSGPNDIPYTLWTSADNDSLHIPSKVFQTRGLSEERSQYDITVKLFLLPQTHFADWRRHLQEAVAAVLEELDVDSIDLLIVSFPGISFDAESEGSGECGSNRIEATDSELMDAVADAWEEVELLHSRGVALKIGLAEFGRERLQQFLPRTSHRPTVDQINVRDCHVLPQSTMLFAKQENLELLTHNDCTDILPQGTLRDLLGKGEDGVGVLAGPSPKDNGLKGDVTPEWVVKYTAVVRDRGVIENKGYFASAELSEKETR